MNIPSEGTYKGGSEDVALTAALLCNFGAIIHEIDRRKICKQKNIIIALLFIAKILDIFRAIMLIFTYQ
jgi:hypothetical protein